MDVPKIRLYVDQPLTAGGSVTLGPDQSHYLLHVMRAKPGTAVALFNGRDGEWRAELAEAGKKSALLALASQMLEQRQEPDLWLCFAPIKGDRTDYMVEKATELGVSLIQPVFTRHCVVTRVNQARLQARATEAAEQCERRSVPPLAEPVALEKMLAGWDERRRLLFCDETGGGAPILDVAKALPEGPAAVLIGPEGGFAKTELDALRALKFAVPVGLGPRVLRADTAAFAALACLQAARGDWDGRPAWRSAD